MAAILEKVLAREVTPENILSWLKSPHENLSSSSQLDGLFNVRSEFLPYFLNYLRDQTSHLLQGCRSTSTTPAKTPTTAKLRRLSTLPITQEAKDNDSVKSQSSKRLQLFSTPLDPKNKSHDKSSFLSDSSLNRTGSAPRKQSKNKSRDGGSGKSQRSIQFTDSQSKTKHHKTSLADFLKSPDIDNRSRRTPTNAKWEEGGSSGRRSTGKGRGGYSGEKKQRPGNAQPEERIPVPVYSLTNISEFPPMADERPSILPDGVKVITPSRRIAPTRITASSANADDNLLFKNAPVMSEPPKTRGGVWGQMTNREPPSHDNKSEASLKSRSKPSRRIAPTLLSPATSTDTNSVFSISPIVTSQSKQVSQAMGANQITQPTANRQTTQPMTTNQSAPSATSNRTAQIRLTRPSLEESTTSDDTITSGERSTRTLESVTEGASPLKGRCLETSLSAVTPTKLTLERLFSVEMVSADVHQVTNIQSLNILAEVYALCLNAFLIPNIAVELYFLVQVLTARGGEMDSLPDIGKDLEELLYFSTVHNAVYFSIMVLANINSILSHLDRGTLRLLMDNQRITDFKPEFRDDLCRLYNQAPSKSLPKSLPSPIGGVSFQADTDNRKNFPSERCFHLFKKQRDSFYELLREWEEHHLSPGWSMLDVQGERIERVVGFRTELANHVHFVRLFQSQLIQMCKGDSSWQKHQEDENIALLSELKQTNPKKLKRLRERLVTPALHGGPCPAPSFPGCQEFFRDFISAAPNPVFRQHLSDLLLHKIMEMDEVQLISSEVTYEDDEEVLVDAEDRETLLNCLLTSKLLAKFLGYVTFLPYNTPEILPESLQDTYIAIRNKTCPVVDIMGCMETARLERRTVVTIPWVVEYLSMMDSSANQTQYFHQVFILLVKIYRETSEAFVVKKTPSHILVLAILGWLFELPSFPEGLIFSDTPPVMYTEGYRLAVDNLNVVDQQILYSCCPYLGEVRSLLVDFAVGLSGRSSSMRKITPMSADVIEDSCPATVSDKQLQHQLEDNFFHNHPASLKKTVEFVADRVSSNHIKIYRTQALPRVLEEARRHVEVIAREIVAKQAESTTLGQKEIQQSVEKRATELSKKGRALGIDSAPRYCSEKCRSILSLMLPEETPPQVWKVAALISYRQALDKVNKWLSMHITTHMFKKELLVTADLEKQVRNLTKRNQEEELGLTPGGTSRVSHDLSSGPPGINTSDGTPGLNTSGGTPGLNTSDGAPGPPHNTPAAVSTPHKHFMFESPVRALQNAARKPKTALEDSPIRFVLQQNLKVTPVNQPSYRMFSSVPASPSSKCIQNLSSFDKEPADFTIGARILSSRLSQLALDVNAAQNRASGAGDAVLMSVSDMGQVLKSTQNGKIIDTGDVGSVVNSSPNTRQMAAPLESSFEPQSLHLVVNRETTSISTDEKSQLEVQCSKSRSKNNNDKSTVLFSRCAKCGHGQMPRSVTINGCLCSGGNATHSKRVTRHDIVSNESKQSTCDSYIKETDHVQCDNSSARKVENEDCDLLTKTDISSSLNAGNVEYGRLTTPDVLSATGAENVDCDLVTKTDISSSSNAVNVECELLTRTDVLSTTGAENVDCDLQTKTDILSSTNAGNVECELLTGTDILSSNGAENMDYDLLNRGDDLTTFGILNRSGLGGKRLNVSFHEHADVCGDLSEASVAHSTPSCSPTKAMKAARTLADDMPSCSPTKAMPGVRTLPDDGPDDVPLSLSAGDDLSDFVSPTEPLIALKDCVHHVIQEPETVTTTTICQTLHSLMHIITRGHKEVIVLIIKMIAKLSVELAFTISLRVPDLLTTEVQQSLLSLWRQTDIAKCVDFSPTLCPRHAQLLRPGNKAYSGLVLILLENQLLTLPTVVANATRLINNIYMKCDVNSLLCELLCDVLPTLSADALPSCDTLQPLLQTLLKSESDSRRKDILDALVQYLGATNLSAESTPGIEGDRLCLQKRSTVHMPIGPASAMSTNTNSFPINCDKYRTEKLLTGEIRRFTEDAGHMTARFNHVIEDRSPVIGQLGDVDGAQESDNNNVRDLPVKDKILLCNTKS